MEFFRPIDGVLHAEDVPLPAIAAQHGTPCYVYSRAALETAYRQYAAAFASTPHLVCYALKANSNLAVLAVFARLGNFKVLPLPLSMPSFEVHLHWHQRYHQDPANRWLREVMTDLYAEQA